MVRGINKQIIEIKCPNNECFEKILLFVKADSTNIPQQVIKNQSKYYYESVMASFGKLPLYKQTAFKFLTLTLCSLVVGGAVILLLYV